MSLTFNMQLIIGFIAFFLANEYLRAQGLPGLADGGEVGEAYKELLFIADRYIEVARGKLDVEGLSREKEALLR